MNQTKKQVVKHLLLFLILTCCFRNNTSAQQTLTTINGWNAYVHLPDDYNSTTQLYPVIIFVPGIGEVGSNPNALLTFGPSYFIAQGHNMQFDVNGVTEKPIVISLQPPSAWPPASSMNRQIDSIVARWRVDPNRIALTGLSMGGWSWNNYVTTNQTYASRPACIVAMSTPPPDPGIPQFYMFAQEGGKWWGFEGTQDYRQMDLIHNVMNSTVPGSSKYTSYNGGHCCWNTFYNPSWTENGESIYTWMLKQNLNNTPSNIAPVANAGNDQTITLPLNIVTLSGSGSDNDGNIASYSWSKITSLAGSITLPGSAVTTVTGLAQGVHRFRLTVTDNDGASHSDEVQVTVNPAPGGSCNGQRRYLTLGATWGGYHDFTNTVNPGDTIVIRAGSYGFTEVNGLNGTAACPITIINENGQVTLQAFNINFPSQHVHFTGTGTPGVPFGFKMANSSYFGMHIKAQGPIEIDHVEVTGTNMGIQLRDDNPPAALQEYRDIKIHNVWIHDINNNEGMYIGNSSTSSAPKVKGVHIYDVLIERTAREGLQISNAQNVLVERVKIYQPSLANQASQNHAFNMGHDDEGLVRDMYIQTSPSYAVFFNGGRVRFECSTIDGTFSQFPQELALFGKNFEYNASTWVEPYQQFTFRNILKKNAGGVSIVSTSAEGPLQPNIVENIRVEGGSNSMTWGPGAVVSNTGVNAIIGSGCVPPQDTTIWVSGWPANSPGGNNPAPSNNPPSANAGNDISITAPASTATLNGSGSDSDGSIAAYAWTKIAGPASFNITNPGSAQTTVTALAQGTYRFRLQVTDNDGATDADTVTVTVNPPANQPPTANAGNNISITLPVNSTTLNGSGTDADGSITSYAWTKISGPTSYDITNSTSAQTTVTGLVQGSYAFRLQVTDNDGATAADTVTVTVNAAAPANQAPTANAGNNITVTLPLNNTNLNGSGTDSDGNIVSYAWTKIAGPAAFTITNPTSAQTAVTGLVQGIYSFRLLVTDDDGATDADTVNVTVNAAPPTPNAPPVATAGNDLTITLPTNSITLNGSGTDADGTVTAYLWTKIIGPTTYSIANPNSAQTAVNNLVQGVYYFTLRVTDNDGATDLDTIRVTVNPAANIPPTANAGVNINLTLPTNSTTLNGSGTDTDGTIVSYQWTKVTGPASYQIASPNSAQTAINNLVQGSYFFELRVTDNDGAVAYDTVRVVVNPEPNQAPNANAGNDISITLPVNSTTLNGSGTDADGNIVSYAWTKISGPLQYNIISANSASTTVSGLAQGIYVFRLQVTDDDGASDADTVVVTVNPAPPNNPPVANAGNNITLVLPVNSTTLNGSGTDSDGTITAYQWSMVSGPASYAITNPNSAQTGITGLVQGSYQFRLQVTDNDGATAADTVTVTVNQAPNQPPVADAGNDVTIVLPINSALLNGSGSDADGSISSYSWRKISGPTPYGILNPSQAQSLVNDLAEGIYNFELTVTDNRGATDRDTVSVNVQAAPNRMPVADAGTDTVIIVPQNTIRLAGSGIDPDGQVVAYHWNEISGPTALQFVDADSPETEVSGLIEGIYEFELQVTDDRGAIATDTLRVEVKLPAASTATLFPNPATTVVNVRISANTHSNLGTLVIYDVSGKPVYSEQFMRNTTVMTKQIDISSLPNGVYFVEVMVDINRKITLKMIKQ